MVILSFWIEAEKNNLEREVYYLFAQENKDKMVRNCGGWGGGGGIRHKAAESYSYEIYQRMSAFI